MPAADYEVVLVPPRYPVGLFPRRCQHAPQFVMSAWAYTERDKRGRAKVVTEHSLCLACGLPRPCSYGGNVFVDLHCLWGVLGWHAEIGARLLTIREKWARIATYLFDEDGWNGRHERVARQIDPLLTMRLVVHETGGAVRLGQVYADASYQREGRRG